MDLHLKPVHIPGKCCIFAAEKAKTGHFLTSKGKKNSMYYEGIIIAVATFFIIGIFHPIVIKSEYYWGVKCWPLFAVAGIALLGSSLFISNVLVASIIGVTGCSALWSILEIFEQRERVRKGWFPMNPKRKHEYTKKE